MATPYGQSLQAEKKNENLPQRVQAAQEGVEFYEDEGTPYQPFTDFTGKMADQMESTIMGAGHGVGDTESWAQFALDVMMQGGALASNEYASSVVNARGQEAPEIVLDSFDTFAEARSGRRGAKNWKPWQP